MADNVKRLWPGFWRRLAGYVVDSIVLGVVGYLIGLLAYDQLAPYGQSARLIGFAIAVAYFGVLSSGVGGSRTVGHRMFRLRVLKADGRPVGLLRSLVRAVLLVAPLILNGWYFGDVGGDLGWALGVLDLVLVFGVGLAQVYLLIFGAPDRRLVHDLATGTQVVMIDAPSRPSPRRTAHHLVATAIVGVSLLLALGGAYFVPALLPATFQRTTDALFAPQEAVLKLPGVIAAEVEDNTTTIGDKTTRRLIVSAHVSRWPADPNAELARIARTVMASYRFAPGQRLRVRIVYGFDIGIASGSRASGDDEDIEHWKAVLDGGNAQAAKA
jgi:uncharacterized RDD family membrane protein YckC